MKFLAEHYDVTRIPMAGASGGALAAVLAACGVSADAAFQRAYDMSVEHNIWERPVGLVGVWGQHIEQWLNDLLPDDAAERCRWAFLEGRWGLWGSLAEGHHRQGLNMLAASVSTHTPSGHSHLCLHGRPIGTTHMRHHHPCRPL